MTPLAAALPALAAAAAITLGREGTEVELHLDEGRLRILDARGRTLHETDPSSHVHAWAIGDVTAPGARELVLWMARRDRNQGGTVPHDSGWMSYGDEPWINMHVAILGMRSGMVHPRWASSALPDGIEGMDVEPAAPGVPAGGLATIRLLVASPRGREVVRYRMNGWTLDVVSREPAGAQAPVPVPTLQADLMAVGDVMLGRETGRRLARTGPVAAFVEVMPLLRRATWLVGNLESCLHGGAEGRPDPLAASAAQREALGHLGFHVLNLANNHCPTGAVEASERLLADAGIGSVGTGPFPGDARLLAHGGLRVALAGLMVLPTNAAGIASVMTDDVAARLRRLREGVDFLLVTVHWGDEYRLEPAPEQRTLASWLLAHGVDGILGHHPHVVQPVERDGDGRFVAHSLGNFLFDQEGYVDGADGATEEGLALQVRLHATLGIALREHPIRIVDRHCVVPSAR